MMIYERGLEIFLEIRNFVVKIALRVFLFRFYFILVSRLIDRKNVKCLNLKLNWREFLDGLKGFIDFTFFFFCILSCFFQNILFG